MKINKKLPIYCYWSPTISNIRGKSYLMINNGKTTDWVEVPKNYSLKKFYKEFEYKPIAPILIVKKVIEKSKIVKSKSGNGEYKVTFKQFTDGRVIFECSCLGASFHNECYHIKDFKKELKIK
jgi:hypothetical protein